MSDTNTAIAGQQAEVEKELFQLIDSIQKDILSKEDLKTVQLIAGDIIGLYKKYNATQDESKKEFYKDRISRLTNHLALLTLSRLNVTENHLITVLERVLTIAIKAVIEVLLGKIGLSAPELFD